jgi:hypothetical protein
LELERATRILAGDGTGGRKQKIVGSGRGSSLELKRTLHGGERRLV